ncbi:hypothetical protein NliqN6_3128 [Naganishia liquefaciens]|uniref:asparagine--tRNA ligase n=1 Tax=Naganishia liquefaciens TaxID=104408 RepID=A0A8H3YGJ2_9TREE|nr:hypothetical protein NliqN6_3128 [Naganishia liquefaciens]
MATEQPTLLDQTKQTVAELSTKVADTLNLGGAAASTKSKDAPTGEPIYVDEKAGSDETGNGSSTAPFLTPFHALLTTFPSAEAAIDRPIFTRKADSTEVNEWQPISGAGMKKAKKLLDAHWKKVKKAEEGREAAEREAKEKAEREQKRREEASKIVLVEDESKPRAQKVKIGALEPHRGSRVRVFGWVHRLRVQSQMTFITLRDGTGYLQLVLTGDLVKTLDAFDLVTECTIEVTGELKQVPEGKTAPGGHELVADWWRMVGKAPTGVDAYASLFNEKSDLSVRQNLRHLDLRAETPAAIMKVRAAVLTAFRAVYAKHTVMEVTPPCIVQTSVEGGSSLFKFDYYGQEAYLTQSSQLYLETCLPSLGDVFCVQESFRAENSHTRRHLAEYTHLEAELAFIDFKDLMDHIETMICEVVDMVLADPIAGKLIQELNPGFKAPARPFKRLDYKDAIAFLNEHNILFQDDDPNVAPRHHQIGDDIAEAAERKMTDMLNVPIFLMNFPKHLKSFYMKKIQGDEDFTESVDVLMPNVGEIVGGSMRISDIAELMEGYKREGIPAEPYYWFTDQRKYGTSEHGGYGLGVERFLAWLTNRWTVRECQLYGRWPGHAAP